jgi:hypothetical protein
MEDSKGLGRLTFFSLPECCQVLKEVILHVCALVGAIVLSHTPYSSNSPALFPFLLLVFSGTVASTSSSVRHNGYKFVKPDDIEPSRFSFHFILRDLFANTVWGTLMGALITLVALTLAKPSFALWLICPILIVCRVLGAVSFWTLGRIRFWLAPSVTGLAVCLLMAYLFRWIIIRQ